eukprot:759177-Hanusia_phi.AAC.1
MNERSSRARKNLASGRQGTSEELAMSSDQEIEDIAPPRPLKPPTPQQFGSSLEPLSSSQMVRKTQMMTGDSLSSIHVVNEMHRSSTELTTSQEDTRTSNSRFQARESKMEMEREVKQNQLSIQEVGRLGEVERLQVKVASLEKQVERFHIVAEKVQQLEHELKASNLISDGKIRFLEERVAVLENQLELREGKGKVREALSQRKIQNQELFGSSELIKFTPEGNNPHRNDQHEAEESLPSELSVPEAASEPAFELIDKEGEITDEKLNTFISSIRQRFKETHELLQSTRK